MRISERVYLTASGTLGCSMSRPQDCNAYAVDCGGTFLLIDTGVGGAESILNALRNDQIPVGAVEAILLTHGHLDHAGGAKALHQELGAPVWCSPETAAALESGNEEAISLAQAKRAGVYGEEFQLEACPVARTLDETAESIAVGDSKLRVLRTPGHAHDLLSYVIDTPDGLLVFPGDTVFTQGRILLSPTWDCRPFDYAGSIRKLAALPIDGLYPGHSGWATRDGAAQVALCLPYLDRLVLPPSLL